MGYLEGFFLDWVQFFFLFIGIGVLEVGNRFFKKRREKIERIRVLYILSYCKNFCLEASVQKDWVWGGIIMEIQQGVCIENMFGR